MSAKYELSRQQIQPESESEDTIQENTESENKNTKEMLTPAQSWGGQLSPSSWQGEHKDPAFKADWSYRGKSVSCTQIT